MGLFKTYQTDKDLEKKGVVYTPDASTAITIARAGGANTRFAKVLDAKSKPYRRQIESGSLDPKLDKQMMAEVYAETVIKNWETLVGDEGEEKLIQGIEADPDNLTAYQGEPVQHGDTWIVPFSVHNVVATLVALPDMMLDIQRHSQASAHYLVQQREDDAKN